MFERRGMEISVVHLHYICGILYKLIQFLNKTNKYLKTKMNVGVKIVRQGTLNFRNKDTCSL